MGPSRTGIRRVAVAASVVAFAMASLGASSCEKAQKDLDKATQGLDALTATCAELSDPAAAASFAKAAADQANRSDQPVAKTEREASAALERRCAKSHNSSYQPYTDVQIDIDPDLAALRNQSGG